MQKCKYVVNMCVYVCLYVCMDGCAFTKDKNSGVFKRPHACSRGLLGDDQERYLKHTFETYFQDLFCSSRAAFYINGNERWRPEQLQHVGLTGGVAQTWHHTVPLQHPQTLMMNMAELIKKALRFGQTPQHVATSIRSSSLEDRLTVFASKFRTAFCTCWLTWDKFGTHCQSNSKSAMVLSTRSRSYITLLFSAPKGEKTAIAKQMCKHVSTNTKGKKRDHHSHHTSLPKQRGGTSKVQIQPGYIGISPGSAPTSNQTQWNESLPCPFGSESWFGFTFSEVPAGYVFTSLNCVWANEMII